MVGERREYWGTLVYIIKQGCLNRENEGGAEMLIQEKLTLK